MSRHGVPDQSWLPRVVDGMNVVRPYGNKFAAYVSLDEAQRHAADEYARGFADGQAANE